MLISICSSEFQFYKKLLCAVLLLKYSLLLACQCSPKQITYCREGKNPLKYSGNERIKKSTCIFLMHHRNNFTDYNVFVYYHYVCLFVCFLFWLAKPAHYKKATICNWQNCCDTVVLMWDTFEEQDNPCHSLSPPFKGVLYFLLFWP